MMKLAGYADMQETLLPGIRSRPNLNRVQLQSVSLVITDRSDTIQESLGVSRRFARRATAGLAIFAFHDVKHIKHQQKGTAV
jgi:hypothetical protein